ncbi:hypothetical protein CUP1487 [Campylobacter upsaliensis RM3195]|nr:hypothetical protein CUP1487 [Campylobacter upsaliensis RM3195]
MMICSFKKAGFSCIIFLNLLFVNSYNSALIKLFKLFKKLKLS